MRRRTIDIVKIRAEVAARNLVSPASPPRAAAPPSPPCGLYIFDHPVPARIAFRDSDVVFEVVTTTGLWRPWTALVARKLGLDGASIELVSTDTVSLENILYHEGFLLREGTPHARLMSYLVCLGYAHFQTQRLALGVTV